MFSGPCGDIFLDLHVFVLDPGVSVFWTRAPASWTLPPQGGGELHCYRRSHWAGCFWCERLEERNAFLIFSTFLSSPLTLGVGLGWGGCDNVMYAGVLYDLLRCATFMYTCGTHVLPRWLRC